MKHYDSFVNGSYVIRGGTPLEGSVAIQGAKNAALPMIAAALLPKRGKTILRNVPPLNDILVSIAIAESAGASVEYDKRARVLTIDATGVCRHALDPDLTTRSRASILFLAPILLRLTKVEFRGVGGCPLGVRKLDFHHNGFKRLGAVVDGDHDHLDLSAERLRGGLVYLDIPSQTSTENLMMAAALASGITTIENAACEPEVVDFAAFLSSMGARISGAGTSTIKIEGVSELRAVDFTVMPDRLDACPFMVAAAITGGDVTVAGADIDHMRLLSVKLEQMGATLDRVPEGLRVRGPARLRPVNIVTWPYPGFSTDFFPSMMTLACLAEGTSYFRENVFEDRMTQVKGLIKMGAEIVQEGSNCAQVTGVEELAPATLHAPDLRAGMAYVLAALAARGESTIGNIYQIERGHCDVESRFRLLGGDISFVSETQTELAIA